MKELIQLKAKDLKPLKEKWHIEQNQICPILKKQFSLDEMVVDHEHKLKSELPDETGKGWYYKNNELIEPPHEFEAFVYIIERLNTDEDEMSPIFYIGKKNFFTAKNIETDWLEYYGSSDWLRSDINKYGKENFKRTILHLCTSKHQATYLELKEQIINNVLELDANGYSVYYNQAIFNKFSKHYDSFDDLTEEEAKIIIGSQNIINRKLKRRWINNGNYNKMVSESEGLKKVGKYNWVYGRMSKKIGITNSKENLYIHKNEQIPEGFRIGVTRVFFNNGKIQKKVLLEEIQFLSSEWVPGTLIKKIWINDGENNYKIEENELTNYLNNNYNKGRINNYNKGTRIIFNKLLDKYKVVQQDELHLYNHEWQFKGKPAGNRFNCHNNKVQKWFSTEEELIEFLKNNDDFEIGQLPRKKFTTKNIVLVKDIYTDEECAISCEEFEKLQYIQYVTRKTKKVKIYKNSIEIFYGYFGVFIYNNNFPKQYTNYFRSALRGNNKVVVKRGQYINLTKENYEIFWAKG
jgi:hypothetical protein